MHGLGLTGVPTVRHTGHEGSDQPWDWPPNSVACAQLQALGGTTTYAHPGLRPRWTTPADLLHPQRTVEARELVADAALGLVDAVELVSCFDDRGAEVLYHRLLSCGLRLAAVAGTDVFLSFAHGPGVASNPPGWGRVYARCGDAGLSVEAFTEAVRGGRTMVTNGPWLTLDVAGHGPGAVLDRRPGDRLRVRAEVRRLRRRPAGAARAGRRAGRRPPGPRSSTSSPLDERGAGWPRRPTAGRTRTPWARRCSPTPARCTSTSTAAGWPGRTPPAGACGCSTGCRSWSPSTAGSTRPGATEQLGDLLAVLDRARAVYRAVGTGSAAR